jgi:transketolase
MLLYSLLHLSGYPLPLEELRAFRQMGSKTPGHPEYDPEIGIETTTGPLGQGLANAVGMALAERVLAATFNRPGHDIVGHHTYVFLGDGCLMEGISHEACSLAGTLGLGRLICLYDDNGISIDGEVEGWFTDNTPARFEAYGWQVIREVDGHDPAAVQAALALARADLQRPDAHLLSHHHRLRVAEQGRHRGHARRATGADEVAATRRALDWNHAPFEIPEACYAGWDARARGAALEREWQHRFEAYATEHPALAAEFRRRMAGELPADWSGQAAAALAAADAAAATVATRKASQLALDTLAPALPELIGGSADLAGSNLTFHKHSRAVSADDFAGNYIYFGVREFGMTAVCNGLALHGGLIPYSATFLTFSDYARNALRMAALMRIRQVMVFTHDSIGLGEDGPTHQPVEHLASLRVMPNLTVWRPCDAVESMAAWIDALERADGPTALVFTRQNVPHQARSADQLARIRCGGYVLAEGEGAPRLVLLATGSEVGLACEAAARLGEEGISVRVVSMPCNQLFDRCDAEYRAAVLPAGVPRLALEAGVSEYWRRYVGETGDVIGVDRYGESAPAGQLFAHFGLTVDNVVARARALLL